MCCSSTVHSSHDIVVCVRLPPGVVCALLYVVVVPQDLSTPPLLQLHCICMPLLTASYFFTWFFRPIHSVLPLPPRSFLDRSLHAVVDFLSGGVASSLSPLTTAVLMVLFFYTILHATRLYLWLISAFGH